MHTEGACEGPAPPICHQPRSRKSASMAAALTRSKHLMAYRLGDPGIPGHEDHAEEAMVEWSHRLVPAAEEHALGKVVSKAFHCEMRRCRAGEN